MKKILYIFSFVMIFALFSCTRESATVSSPSAEEGYTVRFSIKDMNPATRANQTVTALDREKKIRGMNVVVFDEVGNFVKVYQDYAFRRHPDGSFSFNLPAPGTYRLCFIANMDIHDQDLNSGGVTDVKSFFDLVNKSGPVNYIDQFNAMMSKDPISATIPSKPGTVDMGEITFERLEARFDFYNEVEGFVLKSVTYKNRSVSTYILPGSHDYSKITREDREYPVEGDGKSLVAHVYGYEDPHSETVSFLIEGTLYGKEVSYEIPLQLPVKRNYLYTIRIRTNSNTGGATPGTGSDTDKLKFDVVVNDWTNGEELALSNDKIAAGIAKLWFTSNKRFKFEGTWYDAGTVVTNHSVTSFITLLFGEDESETEATVTYRILHIMTPMGGGEFFGMPKGVGMGILPGEDLFECEEISDEADAQVRTQVYKLKFKKGFVQDYWKANNIDYFSALLSDARTGGGVVGLTLYWLPEGLEP